MGQGRVLTDLAKKTVETQGLGACSEMGLEEEHVPRPHNDQVKILTGGPRPRQSMWSKERSPIPGSLELLALFQLPETKSFI
jgi:hypothetical protein